MRLVLDCSVAVKWFVPESDSDLAEQCLIREHARELTFLAPDILVAEIGHTLRRHCMGRSISKTDAVTALAKLAAIRVEYFSSVALGEQAMSLALDHLATFYDALYMSLAIREDARVLTADARMANAFAPLGRTVLLGDLTL